MIKRIFFLILILITTSKQVFAEKIPVKISPVKVLSTHHDEIEVGDKIPFEVINDVYLDDKLFIKQNTPIYGYVEFVHNNGWAGDSAQIKFSKFTTKDIEGKPLVINYPISFTGNKEMANNIRTISYVFATVLFIIRGAEIYIEPDSTYKNIFITR